VWCKSAILPHLITMCHIINLRKMQKTKVRTTTPNQNEKKKKNPIASETQAKLMLDWVWPGSRRPRV
jgi:hypothetical protein